MAASLPGPTHRPSCHRAAMGVPGQIPPGGRGARRAPGHGPFGDKAFKGALVFCGVLVLSAPVLLVAGGSSARALGTAFLVLGRAPYPPDLSGVEQRPRRGR